MCSIQSVPPKPASLKSTVPDDAVEALAGSLGRKEADPEEGKPVADKIKEKSKEEEREKLGEKEETIPLIIDWKRLRIKMENHSRHQSPLHNFKP